MVILFQDADSTLWLVSESVGEYDQKHQFLQRRTDAGQFEVIDSVVGSTDETTSITPYGKGTIWWSSMGGGMRQYSLNGKRLNQLYIEPQVLAGQTVYPGRPIIGSDESMYYSVGSKLYRLHGQAFDQRDLIAKDLGQVVQFASAEDGSILLFSPKQVWRLTLNGDLSEITGTLRGILPFHDVHHTMVDVNNVLWVATDFGVLSSSSG